jgi:membrane associated rhomboid family serine protease
MTRLLVVPESTRALAGRLKTGHHLPLLTAATLALTAGVTASRLAGPSAIQALQRDPTALAHGQLWRLLSPVLVQTDRSVAVVVATLVACAVVGTLGEQVFSRRRWLALYLVGALTGHGLGEWLQPHQGGTSVAFAGVLGGLAAYALAGRGALPRPVRIEAALLIPAAVVDTALGDIHGLPFLAGLAVTAVWFRRDARRPDRNDQPEETP